MTTIALEGDVGTEFVTHFQQILRARAADRELDGCASAKVYARVGYEIGHEWIAWLTTPISIEEGARLSEYTVQGMRAWMKRNGHEQLTRAVLPCRGRTKNPAGDDAE